MSWEGNSPRFVEKDGQTLMQAWEWYESYLWACPYHIQQKEIIGHNFIEGLKHESKALLDITAQGKIFSKSSDDIEVLFNLMIAYIHNYQ